MIEMTPTPSTTDEELEAWFAAAGLTVSVVEHCPVAGCGCRTGSLVKRAA
jgi:hypothetical protein